VSGQASAPDEPEGAGQFEVAGGSPDGVGDVAAPSGSTADSGAPVIRTAVLLDGVVEGAQYTSDGGPAGVTDADGLLRYVVGRPVSVFVGGIEFGSGLPAAVTPEMGALAAPMVVTPIQLAGNEAAQDDIGVVNRVRLLMALDADGDPTNGIQIEPGVSAALETADTPDFETPTFEIDDVAVRVEAAVGRRLTLPTPDEATAHFCDSLGRVDCTRPGTEPADGDAVVEPVAGAANPEPGVLDPEPVPAVPVPELAPVAAPATGMEIDPDVSPEVVAVIEQAPVPVDGPAVGPEVTPTTDLAQEAVQEVEQLPAAEQAQVAAAEQEQEAEREQEPEAAAEQEKGAGQEPESAAEQEQEAEREQEPEAAAEQEQEAEREQEPEAAAEQEQTAGQEQQEPFEEGEAEEVEQEQTFEEEVDEEFDPEPTEEETGSGPITINVAPLIGGVPPARAAIGQVWQFVPLVTDAEGDAVVAALENAPTWMSIDPSSGIVSGTPSADDLGTVEGVVIVVDDGQDDSRLAPFSVEVYQPNRLPAISGLPSLNVLVGEPWNFEPESIDADGDALVFAAENLPDWMTLDTVTGALSGRPPTAGAITDLVLSASDGELVASLAPFTLNVLEGIDLAASGTAVQGSTHDASTLAGAAIDGDMLSYTHTSCNAGQDWWQLDLGQTALLSRLVIDNRLSDALQLLGSSVRLGSEPRVSAELTVGASLDEVTVDGTLVATLGADARQEIVFDEPRLARYLTIESVAGNCLHLANVAAYGRVLDEPVFDVSTTLFGAAPPVDTGDVIGRLAALDAQGDALVYRVIGDAPFVVDPDGVLRASATLDHNDRRRHDFDVVVSDGRHEARVSVTVRMLGQSGATFERWLNVSGLGVLDLELDLRYPGSPDVVGTLPSLDQPGVDDSAYGERLSALLVPAVSGDYEFAIVGDDSTRLQLAPGDDFSVATTIASRAAFTGYRDWASAGTSTAIRLEAGRVHAIRAVHKEGAGNDHVTVGWRRVGEAAFRPIPGGQVFVGFLDEAGSRPVVEPYVSAHLLASASTEGEVVVTLAARDAQGDRLSLSIDADVPFTVDQNGRVTVSGPLVAGTTYAFVVNVDDGTNVVAAPVTIDTTASNAVADALARGDASGVTERELSDALYAARDGRARVSEATIAALAGNDQSLATRVVGPLDWDPTHDSVVLAPRALGGGFPVLVSNDSKKRGTANDETLAIAGIDGGGRYLAFGGNPIHDLSAGVTSGGSTNQAMQTYLENVVRWLTERDDPDASELDIVVAHLSDHYWAYHDDSVHSWLTTTWPNARVNVADACDSAALAGCLAGAELLVIGGEQGGVWDTHGIPFDGVAVLDAVSAARAAGVPVLYLHHGWNLTGLATSLLSGLGIDADHNYFGQDGLLARDVGVVAVTDELDRLVASVESIDGAQASFDYGAPDGCTSSVGRVTCHADRVLGADGRTLGDILDGVDGLRARLGALDRDDIDVFSLADAYRPTQLAVLLADRYREGVRFPMDKFASDPLDFHRSLFADAGVHYARENNAMQPDVGRFGSAQAALHGAITLERTVAVTSSSHAGWSSTGLYAPPGRPVTVQRTDDLDTVVRVRTNMLRDTTRLWNENGYDRPRHLASESIGVPPGGSITFSTPHGGPLYLWVAASADGDTVETLVSGVLDNPLMDAFDETSIAAFSDALLSSDSDWVDISTPYAEVHALKSHMSDAFAAQDGDAGNGYTMADVSDYLGDLDKYLLKGNFAFAGFSGGDLGPLHADVGAWCLAAGLTAVVYEGDVVDLCRDSRIHALPRVQHINADIAAACGTLCAGNPFDSASAISPLGWGENHEMGHHLQRNRLKFYGSRSNEASNNLFSLQTARQWSLDHGLASHPSQDRPHHAAAFAIVQAEIAAGRSAGIDHALWREAGVDSNASERLAAYVQLTYASGNWSLWTKLYVAERVFTDALRTETTWLAVRDRLGFGGYDRAAAEALDGNDFIYIAASSMDGRDHADFLDAWGISVSDAARAQVLSNGIQVPTPAVAFRVRGTLPVLTPTTTVALDGVANWGR